MQSSTTIATCFSSNLGAKALECNPQDVTGTQRYKFFATALTAENGGHKESLLTLLDSTGNDGETSSSQSKLQSNSKLRRRKYGNDGVGGSKENVNLSNNDNHEGPSSSPCFCENGTQTNDVKILPLLLPPSCSPSSETTDEPNEEQQLMAKLQLEKLAREKERKEQEMALPPVTDKQSLEAYRIFLEENEKKDFALREKEMDENMKLRLKSIEDNLYERHASNCLLNQQKVELIRKNKLQSLKKKGHVCTLSELSNKMRQLNFDVGVDNNNTTMKFNKGRAVKGRQGYGRNRKAKEDLELITAYFESNTFT